MTDYITKCHYKTKWNLLKESKCSKTEDIDELLNSIISRGSINKIKWESFDYGIRQGVIAEPNLSKTFKDLGRKKRQRETGLMACDLVESSKVMSKNY